MKVKNTRIGQAVNRKIHHIEATDELINSRGGLAAIMKFAETLGIFSELASRFHFFKGSNKGLSLHHFFLQVIANMLDGSNLNLTVFNEKKNDESYAQLLELNTEELASTDQIKRMFNKFKNRFFQTTIFHNLLISMFMMRLHLQKPQAIILGMDTMVMDNDDAKNREGCSVTYKRVKGFQPLQVYWNGMIVDAIFREGKAHSNHENDVVEMIRRIVKRIRTHYRDVPIVLKLDSGFFCNENLNYFEEKLGIHYICVGKFYSSVKDYIGEIPSNNRLVYNGNGGWDYVEFGSRLKSWNKFRRVFYLQKRCENMQYILDFASSDRVVYTNIGLMNEKDDALIEAMGAQVITPEWVISGHHTRAMDELTNRSLKEFMTREQLPFQKFSSNMLFYLLLVLSFNIQCCFIEQVVPEHFTVRSYVTSFRRGFIDIAVKFIRHSGQIVMKIHGSVFLKFEMGQLWKRCKNPPGKLVYCY